MIQSRFKLTNNDINDLQIIGLDPNNLLPVSNQTAFPFECDYYIYDYLTPQEEKKIYLSDIVGTTHKDYFGLTWLEIFQNLKRRNDLIADYKNNPRYYSETLKQPKQPNDTDRPHFVKMDGRYFIDCEGNHRTTVCKLNNVEYIYGEVVERIPNRRKIELLNKYRNHGFEVEHDKETNTLIIKFDEETIYMLDDDLDDLENFLVLYEQISVNAIEEWFRRHREKKLKHCWMKPSVFQFNKNYQALHKFKKKQTEIG